MLYRPSHGFLSMCLKKKKKEVCGSGAGNLLQAANFPRSLKSKKGKWQILTVYVMYIPKYGVSFYESKDVLPSEFQNLTANNGSVIS